PEPRVRYGQSFLPGLAVLGRQHLAAAKPLLERAEAVRGRRFTHLGRTLGFPGRMGWSPAGLSHAWLVSLNSLDDLLPLGVAAALAPSVDVRRRWYDVAAALVREWIAGAGEAPGVAWVLPALARRLPTLPDLHAFFAAELRADPAQRRAALESLQAQAMALAAAVGDQPADHRLIGAGRALFMAGRFFDGTEARGWLEAGAAILWNQLREQVNEDGGHRSRSPVVHGLVLADYLEVIAILLAANDDVPLWARKRVKGMADFLARLLHPDGEGPLFHGTALGVARPARRRARRRLRLRALGRRHADHRRCRGGRRGAGAVGGVLPQHARPQRGERRRRRAARQRARARGLGRALGGTRRPALLFRNAR